MHVRIRLCIAAGRKGGTIRDTVMRLLSWNIHAIRGISDAKLARALNAIGSESPDVVCLQEVTPRFDVAARVREGLAELGVTRFHHSADDEAREKKYGNVVATRHRLKPANPKWTRDAPWPQLLTRARIITDALTVDVFNAHIPNGSGNGWAKIDTFEVLGEALERHPRRPRVLVGDFNEPRHWPAPGAIVPWGGSDKPDGTYAFAGLRKAVCGQTHPRRRWRDGVRGVLDSEPTNGLRHAFHDLHGAGEVATHVVRKDRPRFFDHALVSRELAVTRCDYRTDWLAEGLSDHAAVVVDVELVEHVAQRLPSGGRT